MCIGRCNNNKEREQGEVGGNAGNIAFTYEILKNILLKMSAVVFFFFFCVKACLGLPNRATPTRMSCEETATHQQSPQFTGPSHCHTHSASILNTATPTDSNSDHVCTTVWQKIVFGLVSCIFDSCIRKLHGDSEHRKVRGSASSQGQMSSITAVELRSRSSDSCALIPSSRCVESLRRCCQMSICL